MLTCSYASTFYTCLARLHLWGCKICHAGVLPWQGLSAPRAARHSYLSFLAQLDTNGPTRAASSTSSSLLGFGATSKPAPATGICVKEHSALYCKGLPSTCEPPERDKVAKRSMQVKSCKVQLAPAAWGCALQPRCRCHAQSSTNTSERPREAEGPPSVNRRALLQMAAAAGALLVPQPHAMAVQGYTAGRIPGAWHIVVVHSPWLSLACLDRCQVC